MFVDLLIARLWDLVYAVAAFLGILLFALFGADIVCYIPKMLKAVWWDPKGSSVGLPRVPMDHFLESLCCGSVASCIAVGVFFLIWSCLNLSRTWWWFIPYAGYCLLDRVHSRGGRSSEWLRRSFLFENLTKYFPAKLLKWHSETPFPPDKPYLFGYHPHGVLGCGAIATFSGSQCFEVFPELNIFPSTLKIIFSCPVLRDFVLAMGWISVEKDSLDYVLKQSNGYSALVVVGGAQEAFYTEHNGHNLVLLKRKGFFRLGLKHGCGLVPVYAFGENNLYALSSPKPWQVRLSILTQTYFGFSVPAFFGQGFFQPHFGIFPARHAVHVVVGDPILCPKIDDPTDAEVDEIQKKYCDALVKMFEELKVKYVEDPENEKLKFVL